MFACFYEITYAACDPENVCDQSVECKISKFFKEESGNFIFVFLFKK